MYDNFEVIKSYVLTLGGFEDNEKLELQIQAIINDVLAYCNRECVPERMELPLAEVIVSELNKKSFANRSVGFEGNITSYKEGDMQISLGADSVTSNNGATLQFGGKLEGWKLITGIKRCCQCSD